ncbi:lysophospholipid acyltransferase family protein [Micropruina glycogenica]|uniref:1-acyl-sn-glycerol-3-phosphate acyltransferase n=1 Tax=Micropruina glycogenica TaxID=75385 RepID=A0A2N9JIP4_9ACTN|nr:lysophospholipid acyltransferase family protein [Micropruina glycogenica]SPD87453.1 1-acyl-sn-glycerol-3-phosphate acyltransferase [Micropruina glycogenica]
MLYTLFKNLLFRPVIKFLYGARVENEANIPATGGVILASNHLDAGDTVVLPAMVKRPVTFPAKAELFAGNRGPFSKLVAWFLKAVGQVPLDRSGGRASLDGLGPVLAVLADGGCVGIYPEGTRSPDGRLYKGKTGVARMALAAQVPVVPVAMKNSQVTRKAGLPWIDHPVVVIGKPLDFSEFYGRGDDPRVLRWVTDQVMAAIHDLSGQTYIEAYGTSVKSGSLTSTEADARILERPGINTRPPEPPATS